MSAPRQLPFGIRFATLLRLLAVQGAWNYETLMGNGIAFAMEPGLRLLPGGTDGAPFRAAMARHASYFNAHPYLAGLAVGALLRAELEEPREVGRTVHGESGVVRAEIVVEAEAVGGVRLYRVNAAKLSSSGGVSARRNMARFWPWGSISSTESS